MAKGKILQQMKKVIYAIMDSNGNFRAIPIGDLKGHNISEDRLQLIQSFTILLLETNIVHNETKLYLSDENISMATVTRNMEELPEYKGKEFNARTITNKIMQDQIKLEKIFGYEIVTDILYSLKSIDRYKDLIALQYCKLTNNSIRESILLDLPKDVIKTEIQDEEYIKFIRVIQPYFKSQADKVVKELSLDSVGYFNYLLYSPKLSEIDTLRKNELIHMINNEETCDID